MQQFLSMMRHVRDNGARKEDRTGTGTLSVFGHQMRFDLSQGFPLVTTKKLHTKSIIHELLWFLRGDSNVRYLQENGISIWNEWADENGELGPIYGVQWRSWPTPSGCGTTRIHVAFSSAHGMLPSCKIWRCRRAIRCFSFMWQAASCLASYTNAVLILSSACRLTSRPTLC